MRSAILDTGFLFRKILNVWEFRKSRMGGVVDSASQFWAEIARWNGILHAGKMLFRAVIEKSNLISNYFINC